MPPTPKAVRVRTSSGWQDIALVGPPGPPGPMGPMGTVYDTDQIGTVKAFSGKVIPTNWMLADGRTLQRADYPQLADAMGIPAGQATFQILDARDRFLYGATATDAQMGTVGGESSHILTVAEMPVHGHGLMDRSIDHLHGSQQTVFYGAGGNNWITYTGGGSVIQGWAQTGAADRSLDHAHQNAGSGAAHNNLPPWVKVAIIIKVTGPTIDSGGALVGAQGPAGTNVPMLEDTKVQRKRGGAGGDSADFTGQVEIHGGVVGDQRHTIVPSVNCYWEYTCELILKLQAGGWFGCDIRIDLGAGIQTSDADGITDGPRQRINSHATVDWFGGNITQIWKLQAGKSYTARCLAAPLGGTWRWYTSQAYLGTYSKVVGYW